MSIPHESNHLDHLKLIKSTGPQFWLAAFSETGFLQESQSQACCFWRGVFGASALQHYLMAVHLARFHWWGHP